MSTKQKVKRNVHLAGGVSIRVAFAKKFGESQAAAIEHAAQGHENGVNSARKGSDPFKWALLICIGYECISKDGYRKHHGITAPWAEIKAWIKKHGSLASHDGDCDYISLMCGAYNEFVGKEPA